MYAQSEVSFYIESLLQKFYFVRTLKRTTDKKIIGGL